MELVCLTMLREGREEIRRVPAGTNLLEAMQGFDDFDFDAPCGGNGTCGKCKVLVDGRVSPPGEDEKRFLSPEALKKGERLACMVRIEDDCTATPLFTSHGAAIVTDHSGFRGSVDPPFETVELEIPPSSLDDQRSDELRLLAALGTLSSAGEQQIPLALLRDLPRMIREQDNRLTASLFDGRLWGFLPADAGTGYGVAVDIGTTTVVAYLLDLSSGKVCRTVSGLNMQKAWGGDVISRVQAAIDSGPEPLSQAIVRQLSTMIYRLVEEEEIEWGDLRGISLAGNTVMMHLFAGISPANIAVSPFIPAFTDVRVDPSSAVLPRLPVYVPVILLPSVSGFIGADIAAGMLATGIKEGQKPALLIDIGTNGELVLGDREKIVACSTAAGPAFEGATISCGVGGIPGAVNKVSLAADGALEITSIAGEIPLGICGSGIIDLVSILVSTGIVDTSGRLLPPDELPASVPEPLRRRVSEEGFLVAADRNGEGLYFTPRDVREVQLAKASVAAGIDVLLESYGIGPEGIDTVYLAGGFGSYIDTDSAVGIGLLPEVLRDRIVPAGNTAGAGAGQVLLSRDAYARLRELIAHVEYLELSANAYFQERYVEQMFFPGN